MHIHIWLCHLVELFPLTVTWQVLVLLPVVVSQRFLTHPVQHKGETIRGLVNSKKEVLEKEACVDYAMHCCITDLNEGEILEEMEKAVAEGITSFKCFLCLQKEGMMVDDGMLARLMLRAKELGAMINIHAENPDLIDYYTEKFLSEGKTSAWYHYMSRPEFVEAGADKRAVHWAKHLDAPLYLVHMAIKKVWKLVSKPKKKVLTYSLKHVHSIWNLHATYTNAKMEETSSALLPYERTGKSGCFMESN